MISSRCVIMPILLLTAGLAYFNTYAQPVPGTSDPQAPLGTMQVVGDSSRVVVQLNDAVVSARVQPVNVIADTVEYNSAAYRLPEDAMLEDLLMKIPGLDIQGDKVFLNGREVRQILVDGQRFFGGNVKAGLQSLPADMIQKIRAYEKEDPTSAQLTDDEEAAKEPVLDLKIKRHMMNGWRGSLGGGYGTYDRYVGRLNANKITKDSQISVMANFNDLNANIGINNASRTQLGGGGQGDSHKRELGLSMSAKKKKFEYDFNLHYDGFDRQVNSQRYSETIYANGITSYRGNTGMTDQKNLPSFDGRFIWRPTREWNITLRPSLKYTQQYSLSETNGTNFNTKQDTSNVVDNWSKRDRSVATAGVQLMMTKRFDKEKKGRNLSAMAEASYQWTGTDNPLTYNTKYPSGKVKDKNWMTEETSGNTAARLQVSYNEPLGKGFHIYMMVYGQYRHNTMDKYVYDMRKADPTWTVIDPLPSNYKNYFVDNGSMQGYYNWYSMKGQLAMRYYKKKFTMMVGVAVQPQWSTLVYPNKVGEAYSNTKNSFAFNVSPVFNLTYRKKDSKKLSLNYSAWPNLPSLYSLLPMRSGTDTLNLHIGNPDLKPGYQHNINFEYNTSNIRKQSSFAVNASAKIFQDRAVSMRSYDDASGVSTTTHQNIDGNWQATAGMSYVKGLKYGFTITQKANADYLSARTYLYQNKTTEVNNNHRFMIKENFDCTWRNSWLELIGNVYGDFTVERSELRPEMNQFPWSVGGGLKSNMDFWWAMRFGIDFSCLTQGGYVFNELNRSYFVLNATLSQSFFKKKLTLSISAFDILGQLPSLTRAFDAASRNIVMYNGYNSYFIARLLYKFNFKKKS